MKAYIEILFTCIFKKKIKINYFTNYFIEKYLMKWHMILAKLSSKYFPNEYKYQNPANDFKYYHTILN